MGCVGNVKIEDSSSQTEMINNSNNTSPENDSRYLCLQKTKGVFKTIYKIISSHLGLVLILLGYSFIGGAIFQALESPLEAQEKHDILQLRETIIASMWNDSVLKAIWSNDTQNITGDIGEREIFAAQVRDELIKYELRLLEVFPHGFTSNPNERVWDFWGALLYSATVYTTIGKYDIT